MLRRPARSRLTRAAAMALASLGPSCEGDAPEPSLRAIEPVAAYSDAPVRVRLVGENLWPSLLLDPASGRQGEDVSGFSGRVGSGDASVRLVDFGWRSADELTAWLEPGLPAGTHPVALTDPRGRPATLEAGFRSLGADREPPRIECLSPTPDTQVAAGVRLPVRLALTDAPGRLEDAFVEIHGTTAAGGASVEQRPCPIPAGATEAQCEIEVLVPPRWSEGDVLGLRIVAVDGAAVPNVSERTLSFTLRAKPQVTSVLPARGGIAGGTDVVVRGSGFLPGTRVFFGDVPLWPDGGQVVDETTISGRAPAHDAGKVPVTARTPIGDARLAPEGYEYAPPPRVEAIEPATGPATGGTAVRVRGRFTPGTQISLGPTLARAIPLGRPTPFGDLEIRGVAPPGSGRVAIWAFDPELGWSRLPDAFTYQPGGPAR